MLFMLKWRIDQDKWIPVLKKWGGLTTAEREDTPEGMKVIGRWHDMTSRTGVSIVDVTDLAVLDRYNAKWNTAMDLEISPVIDDEESATVAQAIIADQGG